MNLTSLLLKEIHQSNGYTIEDHDQNSVLLIPSEDQRYYMPNIIVKDLGELEKSLIEYIETIHSSSLKFYKLD